MSEMRVFIPIAELTCRQCGVMVCAREASIYVCDGPQVIAYCSPQCAARGRVPFWCEPMQLELHALQAVPQPSDTA